MGLDQYLYKTTKKERAIHEHNMSLEKTYNERVDKIWNEKWKDILMKLPHDFNLWNIRWNEVTPEQQKQVDEYNAELEAIKKELGYQKNEDEGGEEVQYWRKAWTIHEIICNVLNWGGCDNCERMYLTKDNIKKIIEEIKKKEAPKSEYDRWNPSNKSMDIEAFEEASKMLDDEETEIFYYAWY